MAVIYVFSKHHAPVLLRSFSQRTEDVRRQFVDFRKSMDHVSAGLCRMQEAQHAFASELNDHLLTLEKTNEFARTCSAACELGSIELMTEQRDQIIRDRLKKNNG